MLQPKLCALIVVVYITYVRCDTTYQGQVTIPSAQHIANNVGQGVSDAANAVGTAASKTVNAVGNAGNAVGQWAGNTVQQAGNLAAAGVSGAGNLAGSGIRAVGNAAGNGINNVGYYAGQGLGAAGNLAAQGVNGVGNLGNQALGAAGNLGNQALNAGNYVFTQAGAVIGQAGQGLGNLASVPVNAVGNSYAALQTRMTQLQLQMAAYKQALANEYNTSSLQYMYMSNMLDNIAIVDLGPYVDRLNYGLAPYGQMVSIYRTNPNDNNFTFPTIFDANGNSHSLPNGFSIQQGSLINAKGNSVGRLPQYVPSNSGSVLNDPNGNQYTLGPDIYLDQNGNLRFRRNGQPWAINGQYAIDVGGNVFDSGGNIIGNLCRCLGITGNFGPNGAITLN